MSFIVCFYHWHFFLRRHLKRKLKFYLVSLIVSKQRKYGIFSWIMQTVGYFKVLNQISNKIQIHTGTLHYVEMYESFLYCLSSHLSISFFITYVCKNRPRLCSFELPCISLQTENCHKEILNSLHVLVCDLNTHTISCYV